MDDSQDLPFNAHNRRLVGERCAAFRRSENAGEEGLKRAAVTLTLLARDDGSDQTALLLTRRSAGLRTHSAQWALPGGRCDGSETAIEAALRELQEETGLALGRGDVLGLLDDYDTRSGYRITPVVVWAERSDALAANPQEVASVHRIPLWHFARSGAVEFVAIPDSVHALIRFPFQHGFLHAPTAAIIYQFCEMLEGRTTRVADFAQPQFAWR